MTLVERVLRRVDRTETCWLWTGSRTSAGYGNIGNEGGTMLVHRVVYEHAVGPIPAGFHIDHLCRVRNCVNPEHLEAVTPGENARRAIRAGMAERTSCRRGHPWTPETTGRQATGIGRYCKQCRKDLAQARATARPLRTFVPKPAPIAGDGDDRHGRRGTYVKYGCRCDPCRAAESAYQVERRAAAANIRAAMQGYGSAS